MSRHFQAAFTDEGEFEESEHMGLIVKLETIKVTVEKIRKILENLDVRKSMGPVNLSSWVLKECKRSFGRRDIYYDTDITE